jgi:hypothetical protein
MINDVKILKNKKSFKKFQLSTKLKPGTGTNDLIKININGIITSNTLNKIKGINKNIFLLNCLLLK